VAGAAHESRMLEVLEPTCSEVPTLEPVFFERDVAALSNEARWRLRENVTRLLSCPDHIIRIRGFALPDENNSLPLAAHRARVVAAYYRNLGLPATRLQLVEQGQLVDVPEGHARWAFRMVESATVGD
jgi:outer membrane protein OmpA-like peptidoglycan-associated protein